MTRIIQRIIAVIFKNQFESDYLSDYLVKNTIRLFTLSCSSLGIGFVLNYILIRIAGVNEYGLYVYVFNLLYLLGNFSLLGVDTLLVKNVSLYDALGEYKKVRGVIFFGIGVVLLGALLFAFIFAITSGNVISFKYKTNFDWFFIAVISLAMLSFTAVNQAALQGLKKIIFSQVAERIIKPALIIIFVISVFLIQGRVFLSFNELLWITIIAISITALITFVLVQHAIGLRLKDLRPVFEFANWSRSSMGFFLLGALYILDSRIDILFLGMLRGSGEVGVYNISLKISETTGFVLGIVNFVLAPVIAKLFENKAMVQLQQIITRSAQLILLCSLPFFIALIFFRTEIFKFFRMDSLEGPIALIILCSGQIINIFFGSVGTILIMTGNQKFSVYAVATGTTVKIILDLLLIPGYGIIGTAIATAGSMVIWNFLMYFFVRKRLKIHTTAFSVI